MKKSLSFLMITFFLFVSSHYGRNSASFTKTLLDQHNRLRQKHGAPPMKWSKTIQRYAQEWAEKNAREDKMHHRSSHKYGENIYWFSGGKLSWKSVVNAWYSEIKYYNFNKPGFSYKTGHFTQVIWKSSTKLGCGWAKSRRGGIYVVCNYSPAGNYMGRFRDNVLRPR